MNRLKRIREIFDTIKHRSPSQIFCPRCTSPKIQPSSGLNMILPMNYFCEECGYIGPIVLEFEKEEK